MRTCLRFAFPFLVLAATACESAPGSSGGFAPIGDAAAGDSASGETAAEAGGTAADAARIPEPGAVVSATCVDGKYAEVLPDGKGSIAALKSGYTSAKYLEFILDVLAIRYPVGRHLIEGGMAAKTGFPQHCVDMFLSSTQRKSAATVLPMLSTLVHECGHMLDIGKGGFASSAYILSPTVQFTCQGAGHAGQNQGFARNLLRQDAFSEKWPPCNGNFGNCDTYADSYLDGDAKDGKFQGGDQAYSSVLEETVQYVNSLATDYTFRDQMQAGSKITARDGILTFLWYVQRYLHMARLQYPAVYTYITGNACWREATLTVWGRAWLYLEATKNLPQLSIHGDALLALVKDPVLLDEIARLRQAHGCK